MKIAISDLKPQESLVNIDSTAGQAIVGGETQVEIFTTSSAFGDFTFTESEGNVYNFEFETKQGKYSGSFGLGYSIALSFDAYSG